jgi:hypothetical protein
MIKLGAFRGREPIKRHAEDEGRKLTFLKNL